MNKIDSNIHKILTAYPETINNDRLFWFNYLEEFFLISKTLSIGSGYNNLKIIMTQLAPSANYIIKRKQQIVKELNYVETTSF